MKGVPGPIWKCVVCGKQFKLEVGQTQIPKHKHKDMPLVDCAGVVGEYLGMSKD